MGGYGKAESLFKESLELRKRILGEEDLEVAYSQDNLASLYQKMGGYARAELFLRQSLELKKGLLGEENLERDN
jgi:hypothetical protein